MLTDNTPPTTRATATSVVYRLCGDRAPAESATASARSAAGSSPMSSAHCTFCTARMRAQPRTRAGSVPETHRPPDDQPVDVGRLHRLRRPVAHRVEHRVARLERRLADHRLGVDQQPPLAAGPQDVVEVGVAVDQQLRADRGGDVRRGQRDGLGDEPLEPWKVQARQRLRPPADDVDDPHQRDALRCRPAQPSHDRRRDVDRPEQVARGAERRAGVGALEEHRAGRLLVRQQPHRAVALVRPQRRRLVEVLLVPDRDLEHRRLPVFGRHRQHERVGAAGVRRTQAQPPAIPEPLGLAGHSGQPAIALVAEPPQDRAAQLVRDDDVGHAGISGASTRRLRTQSASGAPSKSPPSGSSS